MTESVSLQFKHLNVSVATNVLYADQGDAAVEDILDIFLLWPGRPVEIVAREEHELGYTGVVREFTGSLPNAESISAIVSSLLSQAGLPDSPTQE
jgi:Rieske Fe-S protein